MGKSGPAPTPTKVKILRGETRPSRVNYREPLPPFEGPRMPADMTPAAKSVWQRVLRTQAEGVIRAADHDLLRQYAEAVARSAQASRLYAVSGPLTEGFGGALVKNPLHQVIRDNADLIVRLARELGLSPSARTGFRVDPTSPTAGAVNPTLGLPPRLRAVGDGD